MKKCLKMFLLVCVILAVHAVVFPTAAKANEAITISPNDSVEGTITSFEKSIDYTLTLNKPGMLTASVSWTKAYKCVFISVSKDGITYGDNHKVNKYENSVDLGWCESGTYTITAYYYESGTVGSSGHPYVLTTSFEEATYTDIANINDKGSAKSIEVGESLSSVLWENETDEYYTFTLTKASNVTVTDEYLAGQAAVSYEVISGSGDTYTSLNDYKLSSGTYYIHIYRTVDYGIVAYSVTLSATEWTVTTTTEVLSQAGTTCYSDAVTLQIKYVSGAYAYEIYQSTKKNSGYKKVETVTVSSSDVKGTVYTTRYFRHKIENLKPNKKYYFKVRLVYSKDAATVTDFVYAKIL